MPNPVKPDAPVIREIRERFMFMHLLMRSCESVPMHKHRTCSWRRWRPFSNLCSYTPRAGEILVGSESGIRQVEGLNYSAGAAQRKAAELRKSPV